MVLIRSIQKTPARSAFEFCNRNNKKRAAVLSVQRVDEQAARDGSPWCDGSLNVVWVFSIPTPFDEFGVLLFWTRAGAPGQYFPHDNYIKYMSSQSTNLQAQDITRRRVNA